MRLLTVDSRMRSYKKNVLFSYLASIISALLGFVSRTVFLHYLSVEFLGINGLFSEVLGILSLAELGIPTAVNFELYKLVSVNNTEKIKSIMAFYRKAYAIIAMVIAAIGLLLFPFLDYLVKDPGNIGDIRIYYLIFLFNTVITYFVSYKYSLANAEQKLYLMTNINSFSQIVITIVQIFVLIVSRQYLFYLIAASLCGIIKLLFTSIYFDKRYPLLTEKADPLDHDTKEKVKTNVRGLILNRVGDACIHQTDNIIISSFINIVSVGLLSNYTMIMTRIGEFINVLFTSSLPSLGNLVATTDKEEQLKKFKIYNYADFWIYGFSSIAFYILLTPTIELWLGKKMVIDEMTILLICLNSYLVGQRVAFLNFKTACGSFDDDKYIPLIASVVNIVISVFGAIYFGLLGVFIGTIVSGLVQSIARPWIGYERITGENAKIYFLYWIRYFTIVVSAAAATRVLVSDLIRNISFLSYLKMIAIVSVVPNAVFFLFTFRETEFQSLKEYVTKRIRRNE